MAVFNLSKSVHLLLSGELEETERKNHLDALNHFVDCLSYRVQVFKPGTHECDGQDCEAFEDNGRWFILKPDFNWAGETAALIAIFEAGIYGRTYLLKKAILGNNPFILNTEYGRALIGENLKEPTQRQRQKLEIDQRDALLLKRINALNKLFKLPIYLSTARSVKESAIEKAAQDYDYNLTPETIQRHIIAKRKKT